MDKFVIPSRDDDLLRSVNDAYCVAGLSDENGVREAMNGRLQALALGMAIPNPNLAYQTSVEAGEYTKVHDFFDAFFSLIRHSSQKGAASRPEFPVELKALSFEILATGQLIVK